MNHNQSQLEQSLLELHYGLLEQDEASQLRQRIESEADVAKLWAQTLGLADQLSDAAKLADSPIVEDVEVVPPSLSESIESSLSSTTRVSSDQFETQFHGIDTSPLNGIAKQDILGNQQTASDKFKRRKRTYRNVMKVLASIAALLFIALSVGYLANLPASPAQTVRIDVQSVAEAGNEPNSFEFLTRSMTSSAANSLRDVSAKLVVSIQVGNAVLHTEQLSTGASGRVLYTVPKQLKLPKDARLNVVDESGQSVVVPLEPTRCLTHLTIDKPVYRPGETIHFRSLSLERYSLQPNVDLPIRFEMFDPSGAVVAGGTFDGVTERGVGNGEFRIPTSAPGGQYKLVAKSLDGFFPEESRTLQVRNYRAPRFKKDLEFKKRSYGPGELVEADFEAIRAEGGPLANQSIKIAATVDGKVVYQDTTKTTDSGTCSISFELPELISKGAALLSVSVFDGGTEEVKSKTIPIQLGQVAVEFYPEGGYLADGLKNRVYFVARNPLGDPIHIAGEILDRRGNKLADVETVRDGMGRFEFTPKDGEKYSLKVTAPLDVTNSPSLPAVGNSDLVLSTGNGVFKNDEHIKFELLSATARKIEIQSACRGKLVARQQLELKPGKSQLEVELPADVSGVVRLTVLNADVYPARPLVERLVYRESDRKLNVNIQQSGSTERTPGEQVRLALSVTDENGKPTPAILGIAVVDDAALSLQNDEQPQMPTHFVLTSEIEKPEDLEHANFYLSGSDESRESLDLLLGTQGWRRFVTSSLASQGTLSQDGFSEEISRLLELEGNPAVETQLGNVSVINDQWRKYSNKVASLRQNYWFAVTWFVMPLVIAMMLVYLLRPRISRASSISKAVGMLLLLIAGCLLVIGCSSEAPNAAYDRVGSAEPRSRGFGSGGRPMDDDIPSEGAFDEVAAEAPVVARGPIESAGKATPSFKPNGIRPNRARPAPTNNVRIVQHDSEAGQSESEKRVTTTEDIDSIKSIRLDQRLQEILHARGLDAAALSKQLLDELRFPVREYSHKHVSTKANVREDFTETLYWQPMLITDSQGIATIRFDLSDSVTTFKVLADAHSNDGRIGTGGGELVSRIPLQIEPKLPIAVTNGDRIDLPVAVINATDDSLPVEVSIKTDSSLKLSSSKTLDWELTKQQRIRGYFSLDVAQGDNSSEASIELTGTSSNVSDAVRRKIKVSPNGYPHRESVSGVLNEKVDVLLPIPEDAVPGSLAVTLKAYPSPLADLLAGVDSILQEPHGCFEQTSATNYPNTMALQYLRTNQLANPQTTRRAKSLLDKGYQKLVSFECSKLGYEWFGSDPGHEALSAFGLLQFNDMAKIMKVDVAMIARTRKWLMDRRDGDGGFRRNPRHLHSWSVKQKIVNAYILWAITESDAASGNPQRSATELLKELNQLKEDAGNSDDPYLIGLAAASLLNVEREADGKVLLDKLAELQKPDGMLDGIATVTSSGGISKSVETTAIGILAWAKLPGANSDAYQKAAQWLVKSRQGSGGFGSTQATVLALKALVEYSRTATSDGAGETLYVKSDGEVIGKIKLPQDIKNGSVLEIAGLGQFLDPGQTSIQLVADNVTRLPFSVEVLYHTDKPPSSSACPVELTTEFENVKDGQVDSGSTLHVKSVLTNKSDEGLPMTVATIGLPGGVEARVEQLDEMRESGVFDFYEIRPREVICYWRTIQPDEKKVIEFDVSAEIPGKYTGPASRAYLYYTAEQKFWAKPLMVEIKK